MKCWNLLLQYGGRRNPCWAAYASSSNYAMRIVQIKQKCEKRTRKRREEAAEACKGRKRGRHFLAAVLGNA